MVETNKLEGARRIDAEYYQPIYSEVERKLERIGYERLDDMASSIVNFGAYSLCNYIDYVDEGIPYINVKNVKENYFDFTDLKYITLGVHEILRKSQVFENQVLLTIAGTIGMSAVAFDLPKKANSNQAIAKITLTDGYSPYFLSTFLNCRYGKLQTKRLIVSNVQPNLLLVQVKSIKVPMLDKSFQDSIENEVKNGLLLLRKAQDKYDLAESLMMHETLGNATVKNELSYEANLSDCVQNNRIDAEYYQPKYQRVIEKARQMTALVELGKIVKFTKGIEVGSDMYQTSGVPFVRVSNLSKLGLNSDNQKFISEDLYRSLKDRFEPQEGEVLLSKDATLGVAYPIEKKANGVVSGGILRLKLQKNIDSYYLAIALNSGFVHRQIQRDAGGSVIEHWRLEQIKKTLVPMLPMDKQKEIADAAHDSMDLRAQALRILWQAKVKVEAEIEKDAA